MAAQQDNWLTEQVRVFSETRERFTALREVLQRALAHQARGLSPEIIVQSRVKTVPSFVGKILRKRNKYKDPVRQLTDLCGARVIAGSSDETVRLCHFIENHFDVDWENSVGRESNLPVTEFGYRSVHYIISLRADEILPGDVEAPPSQACPSDGLPMKAEIQVRTFLEHAWAVFSHDRIYKSEFEVPPVWRRELAAQAAALENADQAFARIGTALDSYATHYGAYLTTDEIMRELEIIRTVLDHDQDNHAQAIKGAKLAATLGHWQTVDELLSPRISRAGSEAALELGNALCRQALPHEAKFRQGVELLEQALSAQPGHIEASLRLATFLRPLQPDRSRQLTTQAFETHPTDPYVMWAYLLDRAEFSLEPTLLLALRPLLEQAIARCREQIMVKVNRPTVFFVMGALQLLAGQPMESLASHAQGILHTTAPHMLDDALRDWMRLARLEKDLHGWNWIQLLLLTGRCARHPDVPEYRDALNPFQSRDGHRFQEPVVVLAGGCSQTMEARVRAFGEQLPEVFKSYSGMVVSGGTRQGVAGLAGDLGERFPESIQPVGYIPRLIPSDARTDRTPQRYRWIRQTNGMNFSPLEPLQSWVDMLVDGVSPGRTVLLGFNGGAVAMAEYQIALALGCRVGLIEESGRSASKLLQDPAWSQHSRLVPLPATDPATLRMFIHADEPSWFDRDEERERMARALHEHYLRMKKPILGENEAPWDELKEIYKNSNRQQADNIAFKLKEIGCRIIPLSQSTGPEFQFTQEDVERLAELEHGRWCVDRLLAGWRLGPRDNQRKRHNQLIPWLSLDNSIKQIDRDFILTIPSVLAGIGYAVERIDTGIEDGGPDAATAMNRT